MKSYTVFFQRDVVEEQTVFVLAENVADAVKKAKEDLRKNEGSWECVQVGPAEMVSTEEVE